MLVTAVQALGELCMPDGHLAAEAEPLCARQCPVKQPGCSVHGDHLGVREGLGENAGHHARSAADVEDAPYLFLRAQQFPQVGHGPVEDWEL